MLTKYFKTETDNTFIQLFRYTFVGGLAFIIDFASLYLFTEFLHIYYLISAALAFSLGLVSNYGLSVIWVFNKRIVENKWLEFGIFTLIGLVGLGLNELIIWYLTEFISLHYLFSKIAAVVIIYLWNFFARKLILFT